MISLRRHLCRHLSLERLRRRGRLVCRLAPQPLLRWPVCLEGLALGLGGTSLKLQLLFHGLEHRLADLPRLPAGKDLLPHAPRGLRELDLQCQVLPLLVRLVPLPGNLPSRIRRAALAPQAAHAHPVLCVCDHVELQHTLADPHGEEGGDVNLVLLHRLLKPVLQVHDDRGFVPVLAALNVRAQLLRSLGLGGDLHGRRRGQRRRAQHPLHDVHPLRRRLQLREPEAREDVAPGVLEVQGLHQRDAQRRVVEGRVLHAALRGRLLASDICNLPRGQLWNNEASQCTRADREPVEAQVDVQAVGLHLRREELLQGHEPRDELQRLGVEVEDQGDLLRRVAFIILNPCAQPLWQDSGV
mmetsp:Transcript_40300/g.116390  ORF Transcript_40300/g.116390 Transcript_40300/m.116390 type:complete len:356 (-) Transcript_40300:932-1999(-)